MDNKDLEKEYQNFISELQKKAAEIKNDFNRMSPCNQNRFKAEADSFLDAWRKALNARDVLK